MIVELSNEEVLALANSLTRCNDPLYSITHLEDEITYKEIRIKELQDEVVRKKNVLFELKVNHGLSVVLRDKVSNGIN